MNIYLTELQSGDRLTFPMLPEKISVSRETSFASYQILQSGEIKIPQGNKLKVFSWDGLLPGEARKNFPFVKKWVKPSELAKKIDDWRQNNFRLKLLITESSVNIVIPL